MGFVQGGSDPCIYRAASSREEPFLLGVYVDDIVLATKSSARVEEVLGRKFDIKDMGKLHHFLGMKISFRMKKQGVCVDWAASIYRGRA